MRTAHSGVLGTLFMLLSRSRFADHRWKALKSPSFLLSQLVYSSNQNVKSNGGLWIRRKWFPNQCFFDPAIKDGKTPCFSEKRTNQSMGDSLCFQFQYSWLVFSLQVASGFSRPPLQCLWLYMYPFRFFTILCILPSNIIKKYHSTLKQCTFWNLKYHSVICNW